MRGVIEIKTLQDFYEMVTVVVSVVTPAPVCVERQESVFSVTGFLTFAVVASTAISNVISNIDNNNNNNNNNGCFTYRY